MPKFFLPSGNFFDNYAVLNGEDYSHLKTVLRCKVGEQLLLCDGEGKDYSGVIEEINATEIKVCITESHPCVSEPSVACVLFQALPKGEKMELIIQKAVELGISAIVPVKTSRCVMRLSGKDESKKIMRWQKIAQEAAKQCGRGVIPKIHPPVDFKTALCQMLQYEKQAILYENETTRPLREVIGKDLSSFAFMVGPEGGFSREEIEEGEKQAIPSVHLGPRILRTETAALCVLSILMYLTENL